MKLVIDIPKDMYESIKQLKIQYPIGGRGSGKNFYYELLNCIKQGIPLPKGHGRLIDADALEVSMADDWHTANEIANCIKCAPTIIEADKESD